MDLPRLIRDNRLGDARVLATQLVATCEDPDVQAAVLLSLANIGGPFSGTKPPLFLRFLLACCGLLWAVVGCCRWLFLCAGTACPPVGDR